MDTDRIIQVLIDFATTWSLKLIGVLVVLILAWILSGWLRRRMIAAFERSKFDLTMGRFFANLARYSILVAAGLGCLGVFGIQTASFAAVIAAAGLAIGLAFQGSLANFSSGVMLLVFRPFKVGDVVKIAGQLGKIVEIELFMTHLDSFDNHRYIIPNRKIFGDVIENVTFHDHRRIAVSVGVDYGADLDKTREVLQAAANSVPGGLKDPAPGVMLLSLGDSAVDWSVRVWATTDTYWDVAQATVRAVKQALDEAGLSIPFPQMDVHLDQASAQGAPSRAA